MLSVDRSCCSISSSYFVTALPAILRDPASGAAAARQRGSGAGQVPVSGGEVGLHQQVQTLEQCSLCGRTIAQMIYNSPHRGCCNILLTEHTRYENKTICEASNTKNIASDK